MPTPVVLVIPLDYVLRPAAEAIADLAPASAGVSVQKASAAATVAAVEATAESPVVEVVADA